MKQVIQIFQTDAPEMAGVLALPVRANHLLAWGAMVGHCYCVMRYLLSPTLLRLLPSYLRWADAVHPTPV